IFVIGVTVFTAASVASSFAPSPEMLNAARFVQGVGSGLLNPQGVGTIQQYFRGAERGRAFGYFGSVVGVAVGIGPVLGGLLIKLGGPDFGWRLTFLVNVPVGIVTIILAFLWFPKPLFRRRPPGEAGSAGRTSIDPVGSLLLGLAVLALLFPFMESRTAPSTWLLLLVRVQGVAGRAEGGGAAPGRGAPRRRLGGVGAALCPPWTQPDGRPRQLPHGGLQQRQRDPPALLPGEDQDLGARRDVHAARGRE